MSLVPTRKETPQIVPAGRGVPLSAGPRAPGPSAPAGGGAGITGKDILRMLRRRKWMIILSVFIFTVAAGVSTWLWLMYAPLYTSSAFLKVNPPKASEMHAGNQFLGEDIMERLMMTYAQASASEKVLGEAAKALIHTHWYSEANQAGSDPVQVLMKEVSIGMVPKTSLLRVSMTGQDRNEITEIVNAVATAAEKDSQTDAGDAHNQAILRIQAERKSMENVRDENANKIQALQERGLGGEAVESRATIAYKQGAYVSTLSQLTEEFKQVAKAWDNIKGLTDEELAQQPEVQQMLNADPELQQLRYRVLGLKIDLAAMKDRFGPNHKSIIRLETALSSAQELLEQKKQELTQQNVQQLKILRENDFLQRQEAIIELGNKIKDLDEKLKTLEKQENELLRAKENEDAAEESIAEMDARLMDLRMLMQGERPLVLYRRAMPPREPSTPKYIIMIPAGVMLGLVLGVGLAFLLEFLDTSIKAPSDVSRRVDLPLLGMIPHLDDVEEDIEDMRLAFLTNPKAIISEAFRQTRTTLMFSGTAEQRKSILISSAMPEDGRTTVALNLAHAIVSGGKKVLVVDANFRQPMIRTLFPQCPDGGLSTALVGQADWRSLVHEVEENLYVMASGPQPPNPADLLGSGQMRRQIEEFCEEYDQILFDSSPCLVVSDAVTLSTMVEGAILVVRAGVNTYGIVQRARDMITRLGTPIFGVILNGVRVTAGGYLRKNYETFYEYREQPKLAAAEVGADTTATETAEEEE
ncbi:MAG: polysaccharide biosynthesis tyrosine autokinase [Phycisphaerae bacterium]|nr:polysaccharide biosynthesis tyrosine autokinase [Phycisphaerae bacterium]